MEKEGYVSLWIGNAISDEELLQYLELKYSHDGDYLPSPFLNDFKIDINDFEEDFIERVCLAKNTSSIRELITGCSYSKSVISEFEKINIEVQLEEFNAAILLYNFQYKENVKSTFNKKFMYIGSVSFIS